MQRIHLNTQDWGKQEIAKNQIIKHLMPYALDIIPNKDANTAKIMWDTLEENYSNTTPANQIHLW